MNKIRFSLSLVSLLVSLGTVTAHAADWRPNGPVRIIVPLAAGGATDVLARVLAERMKDPLAQPVLVENRPGGNSQIAIDALRAAPADGRSILIGTSGMTVVPATQKVRYDMVKDFAPASLIASIVHVLAVGKHVPATNVKELVAYAKTNPGKLNYGSLGAVGSLTQLEVIMMNSLAGGLAMVHVPYNSTPTQLADLSSGRIDLLFNALGTLKPLMDSGAIRGLAVTSSQRSGLAPTLPTMAEAGVPGYDATLWLGFLATAGTAPEVGERINDIVAQAIKDPEVQKQLVLQGMDGLAWGPKRFADFIKADLDRWAAAVKAANIKVE
jgi:tripartite-type tricarboxylate transporter receptor subunit TctC